MTTVEAIKKIKELFMSEVPAPVAPAPVLLAAVGTAFEIDGGVTAYVDISDDNIVAIDMADAVFSDEALTMPYPDGTYTVTGTGATFTVLAGVVTVSSEVMAEQPLQAEAVTPAPLPNQFSAIQKDNTNAIALLKAENEKQKEVITQMFAVIEKMAAQETVKPLENKIKTWAELSSLEQFKEQRKANIVC